MHKVSKLLAIIVMDPCTDDVTVLFTALLKCCNWTAFFTVVHRHNAFLFFCLLYGFKSISHFYSSFYRPEKIVLVKMKLCRLNRCSSVGANALILTAKAETRVLPSSLMKAALRQNLNTKALLHRITVVTLDVFFF